MCLDDLVRSASRRVLCLAEEKVEGRRRMRRDFWKNLDIYSCLVSTIDNMKWFIILQKITISSKLRRKIRGILFSDKIDILQTKYFLSFLYISIRRWMIFSLPPFILNYHDKKRKTYSFLITLTCTPTSYLFFLCDKNTSLNPKMWLLKKYYFNQLVSEFSNSYTLTITVGKKKKKKLLRSESNTTKTKKTCESVGIIGKRRGSRCPLCKITPPLLTRAPPLDQIATSLSLDFPERRKRWR